MWLQCQQAAWGCHDCRQIIGRRYGRLWRSFRQERLAVFPYHFFDWRLPCSIVVGNEGAGLSAEVLAVASHKVAIPLSGGVESLNAAVAMSVIFFEAARQRRC
ncbi:MAG: hypothetical protein KGZ57_07500 [Dethiobacter sp.]|nr:hypothetical protein [Dethiobacter sp.]